jgi:hypothetical protein
MVMAVDKKIRFDLSEYFLIFLKLFKFFACDFKMKVD